MLPYNVKVILEDKNQNDIFFKSNEKPFKGEVYTLQTDDGKKSEIKIKEVTKVIMLKADSSELEYHCLAEKHQDTGNTIGFKK